MSEIDKVARLLELATMHRLREEFDLTLADASDTSGPDNRSSPEDAAATTEIEKPEPVGG